MQNNNKTTLSVEETKVLELIPRGLERAISTKDLIKLTSKKERDVLFCINSMRNKRIPICSSRRNPYGFYIATDEEEKRVGLLALKSQALTMAQSVEALEKSNVFTWKENIQTSEQLTLKSE